MSRQEEPLLPPARPSRRFGPLSVAAVLALISGVILGTFGVLLLGAILLSRGAERSLSHLLSSITQQNAYDRRKPADCGGSHSAPAAIGDGCLHHG